MLLWFTVLYIMANDGSSEEIGGPPLTPGNGKIQYFYRKKRNR